MLDFGYYNMDCMEGMKEFPDKYFELAIVDPPYGIERFKHGGSVVNKYGDESRVWNNTKPTQEYFNELFRVSKSQIIWGANNFELPTSEYFIIWDKVNPENFSFAMCEMAWTNCKKPAKIFKFNSIQNDRMHPTQKPVKLYEWLLNNYAKQGYKILDTHVGSASSLIACHNLGFQYVGFELDKEYYEQSLKRLETVKKQVSILDVVEKKENTQIGMEE